MAKQKPHSTELKREVVQGYLAGETLHGLARRHNLPRNLVRIWVDEHVYPTQSGDLGEGAVLDDVAALAHAVYECEMRIEAVERLVAKRAAEFEARRNPQPQGQESPSIPPSPEDSD